MSDESPEVEITVDRGQPVIVVVYFGDGDPDEVYFSYTRPGSERPYTDDGYGQPRSKIVRLADLSPDVGRRLGEIYAPGFYRYVVDTTDFEAGCGVCHFSGEWEEPLPAGHCKASIFRSYRVRAAPEQLK